VSLYQAGRASLGSLLLPEAQVQRLEQMRKDSLDRLDNTARTVSHAVLAGAAVSAISTAILVRNAYKMRGGR
jgi:hypothetical protein